MYTFQFTFVYELWPIGPGPEMMLMWPADKKLPTPAQHQYSPYI